MLPSTKNSHFESVYNDTITSQALRMRFQMYMDEMFSLQIVSKRENHFWY